MDGWLDGWIYAVVLFFTSSQGERVFTYSNEIHCWDLNEQNHVIQVVKRMRRLTA